MKMTQERKFARSLTGLGSAAKVRENVSVAVRETSSLDKAESIEPLDYETMIIKNKTVLHNDPQREMLIFPHDDVSHSIQQRQMRTCRRSVPPEAGRDAHGLLVKECIKSYTSHWNLVHYKYSAYAHTHRHLPRGKPSPDTLPKQVFEVDTQVEGKDEESSLKGRSLQIAKHGWLHKGPDNGLETGLNFTKSFKRRYFYLKCQADMTYVLEYHKDDKRLDAKGTIFMDSAVKVVKGSRRGKNAFELHMQNKSFYLFSAEAESEMDSWVNTLQKVIDSSDSAPTSLQERLREKEIDSPAKSGNLQESLEKSMNPQLQKYARETDNIIGMRRREGRQMLFAIYPRIQWTSPQEEEVEARAYEEQFGTRFFVRCEDFKLRLQANLSEDPSAPQLTNPEPFFITLALFDAREGRKISSDFHFDPNSAMLRAMIPSDLRGATDMLNSVHDSASGEPRLCGLDPKWLTYSNMAVFSVTRPHAEIYLVARIEKVLQGSINVATEPYMKTPDTKLATKLHRQMALYCAKLGHYRMPFAWGARSVFKANKELDTYSDFALYRTERSKLGQEEIIKHLQEIKKVDRQSKWQPILGSLKVNLYSYKTTLPNTLTSSLVPLKPFPEPPENSPTVEVEEFCPDEGRCAAPFTTYVNHLYVCPLHLKYDSQKTFTKARNIACYVEIRDADAEGSVPLKCIYGRPGSSIFTTSATAAVLHHDTTPDFVEEVKVCLPTQLTSRHHLVFSFSHVSCDLSKTTPNKGTARKSISLETPVGETWMPILKDGRVDVGEHMLHVATSLPPGYLQHEQLGMGKGVLGPEIRWVDGRPIFKVQLRLSSTIYTKDQHLHNFFAHCEKMGDLRSPSLDCDTSNKLKSLHAVEVSALINFLPTLCNQLFRLLPQTRSEDVAVNTVRVLIHVVSEVHKAGKGSYVQSYVKYIFLTEILSSGKTVHEELVRHLKSILLPKQADHLVISRLLLHANFFFEVVIKSMAQHLLLTERIKMSRNERFPSSFQFHVHTLIQAFVSHIVQKFADFPNETRKANTSVANFIKHCFTFMDRSFVFRLVNNYIDNFNPSDPKVLHEYKFEFLRIITSHEHYIPLCLPIMNRKVKNYKDLKREDLKHDYTLSDEFRRSHFPVGLLLHELQLALGEGRDVRRSAITTLRDLLAKHAFDDRYPSKAHRARIASLYLPFVTILLENKARLVSKDDASQTTPPGGVGTSNGDTLSNGTLTSTGKSSSAVPVLTHRKSSGALEVSRTRDSNVLAIIAGQGSTAALAAVRNDATKNSEHGSASSLNSSASANSSNTVTTETKASHQRMPSADVSIASSAVTSTSAATTTRWDKLGQDEIKDLLICFLFVITNLAEEIILGWLNNSSESDVLDFMEILEICMEHFKYLGHKRISSLCFISQSNTAMTLPVKKATPLQTYNRSSSGMISSPSSEEFQTPSGSQAAAMFRSLMEANLSSEVALIVLDLVTLYTSTFKGQLKFQGGDNPTMKKIFQLHLHFLQTNQSENVQKHAFASLRSFISKFASVLFLGDATMCGSLCYEILRCCNSRLNSTRSEACALMYLLMRSNFEFCKRKSFTRVHLQMIISVSQLIGDVVGLSNQRFYDSLSVINSFANNDKGIQHTVFPVEVKDLTKRIRTVLMATAKMKEHQGDAVMLVELQYSLAKSYASMPELRKTWLESMARIHVKNGDLSEAAMCYLHIAALVAEYLKRRGDFPQGCVAFSSLSPNINVEESGMREDGGMQDIHYTEEHLTDLLVECAALLEQAERFELLGRLYQIIIPIYEYNRDFKKLALAYGTLHRAYSMVVDVMQTGKRFLGTYFRVAFFGQLFFEEEHTKEYIYKEPKVTSLAEVCRRLDDLYTKKFGKGVVKLISDSNKVDVNKLDSSHAHIQVTHVTPYFDSAELKQRKTEFERQNNLSRFMCDTPFTRSGRAHGDIHEQHKRRVVFTTSHSFPYVKRRLMVVYRKQEELSPIEVAIDEMRVKVAELTDIISKQKPDVVQLELKLQGSISVQVNAGPLAYAEVFLTEGAKQKPDKVNALKDIFREFVCVCSSAVELNGQLISSNQLEGHVLLQTNFKATCKRLAEIFGEPLLETEDDSTTASHRNSITVFNVISATGSTTTV